MEESLSKKAKTILLCIIVFIATYSILFLKDESEPMNFSGNIPPCRGSLDYLDENSTPEIGIGVFEIYLEVPDHYHPTIGDIIIVDLNGRVISPVYENISINWTYNNAEFDRTIETGALLTIEMTDTNIRGYEIIFNFSGYSGFFSALIPI